MDCLVQELLRRNHSIAALTHVINELAEADGHLHDAIQLEDLQLAAYEALGWLVGSEPARGSHAVASGVTVIQSEAPGAVSALEIGLPVSAVGLSAIPPTHCRQLGGILHNCMSNLNMQSEEKLNDHELLFLMK